MAEIAVPLVHGVVPILVLLIMHFFICFLSRKSMFVRYLISGRSAIVISPKGINYKELKKLNMNLDDLIEAVRGCDVFNLDDIAYAIIETNGKMCVIKKSNIEPATKEDLKVNSEPSSLPVNIIMDGKIMKENVLLSGIDDKFINMVLQKAKINKIKEVLIFTLDNEGNCYIQAKNSKQSLSFTVDFNGGERW